MFTERQREILRPLREKATGENSQLLEDVLNNNLAKSEIESVCRIINNEFLLHGILDEKYNPNQYGLELEMVLDLINRPRLS